jgi:hypothetical protein
LRRSRSTFFILVERKASGAPVRKSPAGAINLAEREGATEILNDGYLDLSMRVAHSREPI